MLAGADVGGASVDVLARDQRDIAVGRDGRTDLCAGAQVVAILLVADERFAMAFLKRAQRDVPACLQAHVVLGSDLRRRQGQVAAGLHAEVAGVHARYAGDV
ncbi:hypothetical protein D3C87_1710500 [compost metagenome]